MSKRKSNGHDPSFDRRAMTLGLAKLESSGLTEADGRALGLAYVSGNDVVKLCPDFKPLPSIVIPYWDPMEPKRPLVSWPGHGQFFRVRYLEQPNTFDQLTTKKPVRYVQPPESGVCAYFPRLGRPWTEVLPDPALPVLITEGEFKAAKGCRSGYPVIGLGGVWNWRSNQHMHTFLPELDKIEWKKRTVYIVFDSDFKTNPQVCAALNALAEQLMQRGALPYYLSLPDVTEGEGKTGLDDFLVNEKDPAGALGALISSSAQLITAASSLWKLNERVTYVFNPGMVLDLNTGMKMDPAKFSGSAYSTLEGVERVVGPDGEIKMKPVSAAAQWLKWPLRRQVGEITYAPGQPLYITTEDGVSQYNIWPGWGCKPKKGDVSPFVELVTHLFGGTADADQARDWLFDWLAYPLQHPGTKLFTSVLIHGRKQGTGKSLVGYTMFRIYGKNATEINQADLHERFNEWAEGRQFVMGDDVAGSNKRADADILKKMITQRELRVNAKYVPTYVVPDRVNYYFTSNHPDAFFLEDDDRRFFIHEVIADPLPEAFYAEYDMWLDSGGSGHVFDWLMKRDLTNFNPAARAYATRAKARMISDVKSDVGAWIESLKADPDGLLRLGDVKLQGDLFTSQQLHAIYDPTARTGVTANGITRELKKAGFYQVCGGDRFRDQSGNMSCFFAIRNPEMWRHHDRGRVQAYLDRLISGPKTRKERRSGKY